jgi:hypothetical protein
MEFFIRNLEVEAGTAQSVQRPPTGSNSKELEFESRQGQGFSLSSRRSDRFCDPPTFLLGVLSVGVNPPEHEANQLPPNAV